MYRSVDSEEGDRLLLDPVIRMGPERSLEGFHRVDVELGGQEVVEHVLLGRDED